MAQTSDPDLVLDEENNLIELFKRGDPSQLLSQHQVAKTVKFLEVHCVPRVPRHGRSYRSSRRSSSSRSRSPSNIAGRGGAAAAADGGDGGDAPAGAKTPRDSEGDPRVHDVASFPPDTEEEPPELVFLPYKGPKRGMKVNVIGGATGCGKTSLIRLLAGGMRERARLALHTKVPTIYVIKIKGNTYGLMDTVGLCDTATEAFNDMNLKELRINVVPATFQLYELEMVSLSMLIDKAGRLPGKFGENWPTFQKALGGSEINVLAQFVVSKANKVSRNDRFTLQQDLADRDPKSFFNQLKYSPLHWPVITAGEGNLDDFIETLVPIDTEEVGINGAVMDSSVECLERKRRMADNMSALITSMRKKLDENLPLDNAIDTLQDQIMAAKEEIGSLGACSDEKRKEIQETIKKYEKELFALRKNRGERIEMKAFALGEELREKMDTIREAESLGNRFAELQSVGTAIARTLLPAPFGALI